MESTIKSFNPEFDFPKNGSINEIKIDQQEKEEIPKVVIHVFLLNIL